MKAPLLFLTAAGVAGLLAGSLTAQSRSSGKPPDAAVHKAWMDAAGDLQEDLRESLAAGEGRKAGAAAVKIEALMGRTEQYWAGKRAADVVKLAQESRALTKPLAIAANAGKIDQAKEAFEKLNANCNACHDLHPEKR